MSKSSFKLILIELEGTLLKSEIDEDSNSLRAYQKFDPEATKELLELQKYCKIVAFYKANPEISHVLEKRLKNEGLNFEKVLIASPELYQKAKREETLNLMKNYSIMCYIDETEDGLWKALNFSRMRF